MEEVRQVTDLGLEAIGIDDLSYREITKPLRPMGKATSLLLEILGLLCKSMGFQKGGDAVARGWGELERISSRGSRLIGSFVAEKNLE